MPPTLALTLCALFSVSFFFLERQTSRRFSSALWFPVIWAAILGSRPVSLWFGGGFGGDSSEDFQEGNSFDRNVFLFLILASFWILRQRGVRLSEVISKNKWLFALCLYLGLSAVWSDYPFVSFKRCFKIFGSVALALVVLSEENPVQAIKTVFLRSSYVLLPFSVLLIKYFPRMGRSFSRWGQGSEDCGVSLAKNELGVTAMVCAVFLFSDLVDSYRRRETNAERLLFYGHLFLFGLAGWLLLRSHSSTSLACAILAFGCYFGLKIRFVRERRSLILRFATIAAVSFLILFFVLDLTSIMVSLLGRDVTLTGRTDIWKMVLDEKTNPIWGVGFYTFWLGDRAEKFWNIYVFRLNQAHNGYLELYLDGGIIALFFLLGVLVSAGKRIQRQLIDNPDWGSIAFGFWAVVIIHNWTEASFARLGLLWFVLLLVITQWNDFKMSAKASVATADTEEPIDFEHAGTKPLGAF